MNEAERSPGDVQAAVEQGEGDPGALANPSSGQATRTRMQGGGVGQRELDDQQDPDREKDASSLAAQVKPELSPPYGR